MARVFLSRASFRLIAPRGDGRKNRVATAGGCAHAFSSKSDGGEGMTDDGQEEDSPHYHLMARAIDLLTRQAEEQPSLERLAEQAGMSPFHFQRLFTRWAGVSPKRFLQFMTLEHAKQRLDEGAGVLEAALDVGLSGPSRLHDLFVTCEAVTPGGYKAKGEGLTIRWGRRPTAFGTALLGVTDRGLCRLGFDDGRRGGGDALAELTETWPAAELIEDDGAIDDIARRLFDDHSPPDKPLSLLLRGTNFQIQVWRALLRIPDGGLTTYQDVARDIGKPAAARAVGAAVGANPLAVVIPCHRVIQKTGVIHQYRYGCARKRALIAWEQSRRAAVDTDIAEIS
jgi:AraC family transcriptional regulator, regulatory protein of adaptative response / methylated-DNA-[protein]-cysteine methyltransferase